MISKKIVLLILALALALGGCALGGDQAGKRADGSQAAGWPPDALQEMPATTAAGGEDKRIQYTEEMVGYGHPTKADTLNRQTAADHDSDGTHYYLGHIAGLAYKYASASTITVGGGSLEINGNTFILAASTTLTLSGLGADEARHLCFSAPSSGHTLTASQFVHSATAPVADHAKGGGYYNAAGTARCFGWIPTDGSSNLRNVEMPGNMVWFVDEPYQVLDTSSPATSPTALGLGAGAGGLGARVPVIVHGFIQYNASGTYYLFGMNGDNTGSAGGAMTIAKQDTTNAGAVGEAVLITDASDNIKYYSSNGSALVEIYIRGVGLPLGMRR